MSKENPDYDRHMIMFNRAVEEHKPLLEMLDLIPKGQKATAIKRWAIIGQQVEAKERKK